MIQIHVTNNRYCGKCHTCGTELKLVLDGEEYCPHCEQYRRYHSHGWSSSYGEDRTCPQPKPQE